MVTALCFYLALQIPCGILMGRALKRWSAETLASTIPAGGARD